MKKTYRIGLGNTLAIGFIAGAVGVGVMTFSEKIEQFFTGRPNSYVPAHTLERILRLPYRPDSERVCLNLGMHYGQGAAAGCIRALMATYGVIGPFSSFIFTFIRLAIDQTLENATGVGAPPWTWPFKEQVIDILHKFVYAFTTGAIADYIITKKFIKYD
ncbi:hypothetical protein BDF20DRAFT_851139 [Mycotypha africana]|uniref:uncharacterized protein n=1 Tax=Mycotypha africana TaxID=64632 RepID=UPI0023009A68|nr:uncharacterized protein BDF20DRAFT_851139 [Mycotypha africana]KAI8987606.1 hypothetical protein BDF20DRAFT_851139 [Mycotypha africana]